MTIHASNPAPQGLPNPMLFAATAFVSAALVFLVEPMAAKLALPLLGGGPSVWNTCLAFFQIALLAGYGYAHLLQKLSSLRRQMAVHGAVLGLAMLALPLRISDLAGPPSSDHPILWLLATLTLALGAPFAALSATAPIVQAWHARTLGQTGREPYALYAASNLGSLMALLAYPIVVEPLATLSAQRWGWSLAYAGFVGLMALLALATARAPQGPTVTRSAAPRSSWAERLGWVALAAIPSSLMMGVTTHLTTDVASAPFLWVLPLALYLLTFVVAFQTRPLIPPAVTLPLQAALVTACAILLPYPTLPFLLELPVHVGAFFFTALICHQALVARRPDVQRLTEFYLWMALGGVLGGGINAFLAPAILPDTWEYPIVLALACLARPWGPAAPLRMQVLTIVGAVAALLAPVLDTWSYGQANDAAAEMLKTLATAGLAAGGVCAVLVRRSGALFFVTILAVSVGAHFTAERTRGAQVWRSFFGVLTVSDTWVAGLDGRVTMMAHGTTLHGAQAEAPAWRCRPLTYYSPNTPIGQVILKATAQKPAVRIGAVGLGTGSVAAYTRPGDHLTFFEIDPMVIRVARDPDHFRYISDCAEGRVDFVTGDARLTLALQPKDAFDVLLIDAFSSDAIPAHLLTREAVQGYLGHLAAEGILILHLSNRRLDLGGTAKAVAQSIGAPALFQHYEPTAADRAVWDTPEDVLIMARSPAALAAYAADPRWEVPQPTDIRPWTDDYTNLAGALWRQTLRQF